MRRLCSLAASLAVLSLGAAHAADKEPAAKAKPAAPREPVKARTTTDDLTVRGAPWVNIKSDSGSVTIHAGGEGLVRVVTHRPDMSADDDDQVDVKILANKWGLPQIVYHYKGTNKAKAPAIDFDIQVPSASRLQVVTAGGNIDIDGTTGGVDAHTAGGALNVRNLRGEVRLTSAGGSIQVDQINGTINAETGGGSITVAAGELHGVSTAITGGGGITFSLPAKSRLKVEAITTGGTLSNDFGLTGSANKIGGLINNGGFGTLKLRTGGGNISLKKSG